MKAKILSHKEMADLFEHDGFQVVPDPNNNEVSIIFNEGRVIGEIVGDSESKFVHASYGSHEPVNESPTHLSYQY